MKLLKHIGIIIASVLIVLGIPLWCSGGLHSLFSSDPDSVSSASVILDKPSGQYYIMINKEMRRDEDTLQDWITFFLICNEGMSNTGGNAGNTMMVVAMNPNTGKIRLMMFTWDTFLDYEGYDVPQKIDMPYRNNGPEETMKVFNDNFDMGISLYLSLNYLNLASLIDNYGGVDIDISRAERNALNGMVASKKQAIQAQADAGLLSQLVVELLADEYYLEDYGPDTHLNGLQAVGYGWLQYDSVYNCCLREVKVVANLFSQVAKTISERVVFYTEENGYPDSVNGRRVINLDALTDEDVEFLRAEVAPIFQMSYHNLTEEDIISMTETLARVAYAASRQGVNIFSSLEYDVFPLEATQPYESIAGTMGHLIDKEANREAMLKFMYTDKDLME